MAEEVAFYSPHQRVEIWRDFGRFDPSTGYSKKILL